MNAKALVVGGAIFLAAAGLVFWGITGERKGSSRYSAAEHDRRVAGAAEERGHESGPVPEESSAGRPQAAQAAAAVRQIAIPVETLAGRSAAHLALSEEEARWLRQNGYPSYWELNNLQSLDWTAVRAAARLGDETAQNLLAERLLAEGDVEAAIATFGNPRGLPSPYAMLRAAELQARQGRYPRAEDNYYLFMLSAEYARLMGDHQVDAVVDAVLPSTVNRQALRKEALRSLPDFARGQFDTAARTGLPPPRPSSRPNEALWREIRSGAAPGVAIQAPSPFAPSGGGR